MAPKAEPLLNQRRDSLRTASLSARTAAFELADRLLRFGDHYRRIAQPFDWTFTPTWTPCSPGSKSASHSLPWWCDGSKPRSSLAAQGRCQRALTIFHP
jgi:hypothetical protein